MYIHMYKVSQTVQNTMCALHLLNIQEKDQEECFRFHIFY